MLDLMQTGMLIHANFANYTYNNNYVLPYYVHIMIWLQMLPTIIYTNMLLTALQSSTTHSATLTVEGLQKWTTVTDNPQ